MAIEFGIYRPDGRSTNDQLALLGVPGVNRFLTAQEIFDFSGSSTRPVISDGETTLSMATAATRPLVAHLGDLYAVFFSQSYPDGQNNALALSQALGFKAQEYWSVHAACSGTVHAMVYMHELKDRFKGKKILLTAAEIYSPTLLDPRDKGIFGDGAISTAYTLGVDFDTIATLSCQFPEEDSQALKMPIDRSLVQEPALRVDIPISPDQYFRMNGPAVYRVMKSALPDLILQLIKKSQLQPADIRLIITHQASKRMLDGIREAKGLPFVLRDRIYDDLEEGNWSSGSIPKAWSNALAEGVLTEGDKILLVGFGAGLRVDAVSGVQG